MMLIDLVCLMYLVKIPLILNKIVELCVLMPVLNMHKMYSKYELQSIKKQKIHLIFLS